MKRILKVLVGLVVVIILFAGGFVAFLLLRFPKKEAPADIRVEATPARLERGEYLVQHVNICLDCHSERDMNYYAGPIKAGTEGQGALFAKEPGLGAVYAPNITPFALGSWSDGEIARAITSGVSKDDRPLFQIMPYHLFADLRQEDVYSIIAYLRTLKPISNHPPRTTLEFPLNLIVRTMPNPAPLTEESRFKSTGEYLAHVAGCIECHTPKDDKHQPLPGMDFAGGVAFQLPGHPTVHSANITPDMETGIGGWDREFFIKRFKLNATPEAAKAELNPARENTVMPWIPYSGMTEEDLGAIYDYLHSRKPIRHSVKKW